MGVQSAIKVCSVISMSIIHLTVSPWRNGTNDITGMRRGADVHQVHMAELKQGTLFLTVQLVSSFRWECYTNLQCRFCYVQLYLILGDVLELCVKLFKKHRNRKMHCNFMAKCSQPTASRYGCLNIKVDTFEARELITVPRVSRAAEVEGVGIQIPVESITLTLVLSCSGHV